MGTDRLFKIGSFEEELATSMGKQLLAHQHEKQLGFDRRATKAVDLINAASQLFDEAGFHSEAEMLTRFLERIAGNKLELKQAVKHPNALVDIEDAPGPSPNGLTWDERRFYDSLPEHKRQELRDLVGEIKPGINPNEDFIGKIKEMHKAKSQPEFFEMESILPGPSDTEAVPGGDAIEFGSLAPEFDRAEELSPLTLLELGKKKVHLF